MDARTIYVAPIVPITPPSTVAVGNVIKQSLQCGPLQRVIKTPIQGIFQGLTRRKAIQQGYTYELAPFLAPDGTEMLYHEVQTGPGVTHIFGHRATIYTTSVGVSSTRNLAFGGGNSEGSWGQAGAGASSNSQQLVTNVQLQLCDLGTRITR